MKIIFQLCKSLFIALIICLLLEHFGMITFSQNFRLKRFLNRRVFVHLSTENIDNFAESIKRITEPLREKKTPRQLPEVPVQKKPEPNRTALKLNHRETI